MRSPQCCGKFKSQITRADAGVRRAARRVVRNATPAAIAELKRSKEDLAQARRNQEDHDASHAGDVAVA